MRHQNASAGCSAGRGLRRSAAANSQAFDGWREAYSSGWRDLNSRPLDPQTSAACPGTSTDIQLSLKIRILYLGAFRWTYANGGQRIAKLSEEACLGISGTDAVGGLRRRGPAFVQQVSYIHLGPALCNGLGSQVGEPLTASGWVQSSDRSLQPGCIAIGLRRI